VHGWRRHGTLEQVSRVSDYEGAGLRLDVGVAALRAVGADPAAVSVACALGRHGDCDATIEAPRPPGHDLPRCQCPAAAGHQAGHSR
jgi:hypothetical protein